jgi:hypothetical protein
VHERADVGEWAAEMAELLGIDDRADGLDEAIGDLDRNDIDQAAVRVEEHRARLAVYLGSPHAQAELPRLPADAGQELRDAVAAEDRARPRRGLAAAVAVDGCIGGDELDQALEVALADGRKEAVGERLALQLGGLEARLLLPNVAARACGELAERSRTETHGASLLLLFDPESAVAASAASSRALDLKERARRTLCEAPVEPRRRALVVGRVAASLDATGGSNR